MHRVLAYFFEILSIRVVQTFIFNRFDREENGCNNIPEYHLISRKKY